MSNVKNFKRGTSQMFSLSIVKTLNYVKSVKSENCQTLKRIMTNVKTVNSANFRLCKIVKNVKTVKQNMSIK